MSDPQERRVLQAAVRLLAAKAYTRKSLSERLTARFPDEGAIIEKVVDLLAGLGYIDDFAYAVGFARSRLLERGWGARRVERQLEAAGVPENLAARVVADVLAERPEAGLLADAADRWVERNGPPANLKGLRRLGDYLIRQGFSPDRVCAHLETVRLPRGEE